MSVRWPPLSSQAAWKEAVPAPELTGVSPNRLAPMQQQLVIAHQRLAVAAGGGGLGGEPHDEVDDADAVRARGR